MQTLKIQPKKKTYNPLNKMQRNELHAKPKKKIVAILKSVDTPT